MKSVFCLFDKESADHFHSLRESLNKTSLYSLDLFQSLNELAHLRQKEYDALFIYVNIKRCTAEEFTMIRDFIHSGGVAVAFHATFASFNNQPKFIDTFGAKFIRHGPVRKFTIQKTAENDSAYKTDSFNVTDELFRQNYSEKIKVKYSYAGRTVKEPVIWENKAGAGHVLGISLGHQADAFENPSLVSVIAVFLDRYLYQ